MANHLKPDARDRVVQALIDGGTIRKTAAAAGVARETVRRYRRILNIRAQCGCGAAAGHNGWCGWRYERSPLRQAFIKAWSRARLGSGSVPIRWPFIRDEPTGEHALMLAINSVVPKWLFEDIRADMCQDIAVAVLTGQCEMQHLSEFAASYLKDARRKYGQQWGHVSIDQPLSGEDGRTLKDLM